VLFQRRDQLLRPVQVLKARERQQFASFQLPENFVNHASGSHTGSAIAVTDVTLGGVFCNAQTATMLPARNGTPLLTQFQESRETMTKAIENLQAALQRGMMGRPKVGGFPYLAETLRRAGVTRNLWYLPSCQSLYLTQNGPVVMQGAPLLSGTADVPHFNREALITALRTDQAGQSTFPEFLLASWRAGVVRYDVDFAARTCTYYGCQDESYVEDYPAATIE
jgi:uncharacterized protein YbcV (DUF1398 family)